MVIKELSGWKLKNYYRGVASRTTDEHLRAATLASRVMSYLDRVLASEELSSSAILCNLLRYIVTETLEGRGSAIKEYSIGVDVLNRTTGFDPRADSRVRVQFRRLRSKLRDYYAGEGASDAIRIELPRRRYTPF